MARHSGDGIVARMIFAWRCEDNCVVDSHRTHTGKGVPVLNIIGTTDPFFSAANPWLGNAAARGHCAQALEANAGASIVLIPDAPHTLFNLPAARQMVGGFLHDVLPR